MTTFQDGPAKGQTLMLRRAAKFLRVVEHGGKWDALDQPEDAPKPGEKLHAYEIVGEPYTVHLNMGRSKGSGFYAMAAYKFVAQQPDDATMRGTESWRAWCRKQVGK